MFVSASESKPLPNDARPVPNRLLKRWEARTGLLFLSPWLLGFLLFKFIPILAALGFSFTNFYMLVPEETHFVGLQNYENILTDSYAGASLFGSLGYFLVVVPLEMAVALGLAALFSSERLRGKGFLRPLFFMPAIIPGVSIFFIWTGLADPTSGWLNRLIIEPLGLPPLPGPFSSGGAAMFTAMIAIWSIGPGFLIMYGAMQGVQKELYEAARVDGAGPLTRFILVTLPMISPAIFFALIINLTSAFGGAALLDRGLSFQRSLSPMEGYINYMMFSEGQLGYAAALTWVMFAVTMTITVVLFRSARRWVYFPEEAAHESI